MKLRVLLGLVFLVACGAPPPPRIAQQTPSQWYQIGYHDALAGKIVGDNDALAEDYDSPPIDRDNYLSGYVVGQKELCQDATVRGWAMKGLAFPASCDGVPQAEQLKQQWQQATDDHQ